MVRNKINDHEFLITVIYGFNTVKKRKVLWQDLLTLAQRISQPWLLSGDFNIILTLQDRLDGNVVTMSEIQDFYNCIQHILVNELPWHGDYDTWSNKRQGSNRITCRLDRTLGNFEWMWNWGHVNTEYEVPFISDHAPMLLYLQNQQRDITRHNSKFLVYGQNMIVSYNL